MREEGWSALYRGIIPGLFLVFFLSLIYCLMRFLAFIILFQFCHCAQAEMKFTILILQGRENKKLF